MSIRAFLLVGTLVALICVGLVHDIRATEFPEPAERSAESGQGEAPAFASGLPGFRGGVQPFLNNYCVKCHGPDKSKGDLTLHTLDGDLATGQELGKWESILQMLEYGEMPPVDEPQPQAEQTKAVVQWIESGMRDAVAKANAVKAEPQTRRLTNIEYQNTLSDLLGYEVDVLDDLPKDPQHHYHFNNTAELMRIGPEQLDEYLRVARKAIRGAIVDPDMPKPFKWRGEWSPAGSDRGMGSDEVGVFGGANRNSPAEISLSGFPRHGEFRIRISASAILPPGHDELTLLLNMGEFQGGDHNEKASRDIATFRIANSPDEPRVFEFRGRMENHPCSTEMRGGAGPDRNELIDKMTLRTLVIHDDGTLNDGGHYARFRALSMPRAVVNWIEFEAPITDTWPPKHHTDILFDSPLRTTDELAYVQAVLERFLSRAYRRPATEPEVERFVKIYGIVRPSVEALEEAMRETLAMVLVAPRFLYHTEADPATDEHYALASRLSYFLWASMPDAELLDLAARKKLADPAVIEEQALRMLKDERSKRFVEDFTLQWLSIEKTLTVPINIQLYPRFLYRTWIGETMGTEISYRPSTRDYMMQETVGFVEHLIGENESVLNVVDSDFAILNERLAAHYGVEGVKGMSLRPVPIKPEHHLGGLLTHGSVLIGNGTGTAPHPIYRAVWLREAILGDTVAPPPAEVPALSDSAGKSLEEALSIAELLAKHRTVESCNDCHFRLDPWGIPFEEYNAVGRYQPRVPPDGTRVATFNAKTHVDLAGYESYLDSINVVEVDAKARLPHGAEVDGMRELKDYLLKERRDAIAENVIRRLLSYSIGRHLTYHDRFAVDELFEEAKTHGFGMRDIIVSICKSDVFRDSNPTQEDQP
jgi:mono/diheme cytochrome c family protein